MRLSYHLIVRKEMNGDDKIKKGKMKFLKAFIFPVTLIVRKEMNDEG